MGNLITTTTTTATNEIDQGTKWRQKAQEFNDLRVQYSTKSQKAYHGKNHIKAKEYSEKSKYYKRKMEEANDRAAKIIFDTLNHRKEDNYFGSTQNNNNNNNDDNNNNNNNNNNDDKSVRRHPERTFDFHGLFVKEALAKLEEIVRYGKKMKWNDVTIIVGRGNHSLHGIAKLPSAVQDFANKHKDLISCYYFDQPTKGCIRLELSSGTKKSMVSCIIQ